MNKAEINEYTKELTDPLLEQIKLRDSVIAKLRTALERIAGTQDADPSAVARAALEETK